MPTSDSTKPKASADETAVSSRPQQQQQGDRPSTPMQPAPLPSKDAPAWWRSIEATVYVQPLGHENEWASAGDGVVSINPTGGATCSLRVEAYCEDLEDGTTILLQEPRVLLEDDFSPATPLMCRDGCLVWNSGTQELSFCLMFGSDDAFGAVRNALMAEINKPQEAVVEDVWKALKPPPGSSNASVGNATSASGAADATATMEVNAFNGDMVKSIIDFAKQSGAIACNTVAHSFVHYRHGLADGVLFAKENVLELLKLSNSRELMRYLLGTPENLLAIARALEVSKPDSLVATWNVPDQLASLPAVEGLADAVREVQALQKLRQWLSKHVSEEDDIAVQLSAGEKNMLSDVVCRVFAHKELLQSLAPHSSASPPPPASKPSQATSTKSSSTPPAAATAGQWKKGTAKFIRSVLTIALASTPKEIFSAGACRLLELSRFLQWIDECPADEVDDATAALDLIVTTLNDRADDASLNMAFRIPLMTDGHWQLIKFLVEQADVVKACGILFHLLALHDDEGSTVDRDGDPEISADRDAFAEAFFRSSHFHKLIDRAFQQQRTGGSSASAASTALPTALPTAASATSSSVPIPPTETTLAVLRIVEYALRNYVDQHRVRGVLLEQLRISEPSSSNITSSLAAKIASVTSGKNAMTRSSVSTSSQASSVSMDPHHMTGTASSVVGAAPHQQSFQSSTPFIQRLSKWAASESLPAAAHIASLKLLRSLLVAVVLQEGSSPPPPPTAAQPLGHSSTTNSAHCARPQSASPLPEVVVARRMRADAPDNGAVGIIVAAMNRNGPRTVRRTGLLDGAIRATLLLLVEIGPLRVLRKVLLLKHRSVLPSWFCRRCDEDELSQVLESMRAVSHAAGSVQVPVASARSSPTLGLSPESKHAMGLDDPVSSGPHRPVIVDEVAAPAADGPARSASPAGDGRRSGSPSPLAMPLAPNSKQRALTPEEGDRRNAPLALGEVNKTSGGPRLQLDFTPKQPAASSTAAVSPQSSTNAGFSVKGVRAGATSSASASTATAPHKPAGSPTAATAAGVAPRPTAAPRRRLSK